jgi:hypothetical protein
VRTTCPRLWSSDGYGARFGKPLLHHVLEEPEALATFADVIRRAAERAPESRSVRFMQAVVTWQQRVVHLIAHRFAGK